MDTEKMMKDLKKYEEIKHCKREWAAKNRDKINQYRHNWNANNKEKIHYYYKTSKDKNAAK